MFPLINVFGKTISTYALVAIIAMLLCGFLFCHFIRKAKQDDNDAIVFLLLVAGGILVGGHVMYAITNIHRFGIIFDSTDFKSFIASIATLFGGSVFYGGLIGGGIAGLICIRVMHLDLKLYADLMGITIPLFHGFARIGCFLGGCCYGIESDWGFTAHENPLVPALNDVCRFPVQLLESACNFVIFSLILVLYMKNKFEGRLLFIYLTAYSFVRFFDEYLRGDSIRGFIFGLSTSQFLSVLILIFAIGGMTVTSKKLNRIAGSASLSN